MEPTETTKMTLTQIMETYKVSCRVAFIVVRLTKGIENLDEIVQYGRMEVTQTEYRMAVSIVR